MRKCFVLLLVTILVTSSLLVILPTGLAQTKPATPTFTIEYPAIIDYSSGGLYLNITNQPFTPYTDNGSEINLYYEAQVKIPGRDEWWPAVNVLVPYVMQTYSQQYTMIPLPPSDNMDIRVRALVGTVIQHPSTVESPAPVPIKFKGDEGDWSNIHAVTINRPISPASSSNSPANTDTPIPSQLEPDFDNKVKWTIGGFGLLTVIMFVVLVIVAIVLVVLLLRRVSKV